MIEITTEFGHVFRLRSDGYRIWSKQISEYPLHHDFDTPMVDGKYKTVPAPGEEMLFEWKHSEATCSDEIMEAILKKAFGDALQPDKSPQKRNNRFNPIACGRQLACP